MTMMIQLLSFALFGAVMAISILAIVATFEAELPYVYRALGIEPAELQRPLQSNRAPRVRVTRPLRGSAPLAPGRRSLLAVA
jgi:hypothetical protein